MGVDLPLPADVEAERAVVDCLLRGATDDDLDPAHVWHDGRRAIVTTLDHLRHCGPWTTPANNSPADMHAAALANAEQVLSAIAQAGIWRCDCLDPRHELLTECCGMCGAQEYQLPYYLRRLAAAHERRRLADLGERLILAAHNPVSDIAALTEALAC